MPASALLSAASAAVRVASLNLCTDEYLLLLARPEQIASVSYLSRDPGDSVLWKLARRYPANRGSLESALRHRPTVVLTMGGGGRATSLIARGMGLSVLDLQYPATIADVRRQARQVATLLSNHDKTAPLLRELDSLQRSRPARLTDAAFISAGGLSLAPASLGSEWMRVAGLQQRPLPGGRLTLETLASDPPRLLLRSEYRSAQWSRGQGWLAHPLVRRLKGQTLRVDGRAWTCAGLPMITEVHRIRAQLP